MVLFLVTYENASKISIISCEREREFFFLSLKGCSAEAVDEGMVKMECGLG